MSQQGNVVNDKQRSHSAVNVCNGPKVKRHKFNGRIPVIRGLPRRVRTLNMTRLPKDSGILPLRSLSFKKMLSIEDPRLPNCSGSVPLQLHSESDRLSKDGNDPILGLSGPPNNGFSSTQN